MTTYYATTEDELELLDSARRVLGGNLFEFLLSGLGEPHHPRRRFSAKTIRAHGPGLGYQLEVVAESEKGLPGGSDPLVMAALVHLLWTGERGRDEVIFRDEALLGILSWPDTRESRVAIEVAVERYYNSAYHRTSREPLGPGRGERVSSQVQKLVPGYEITVELLSDPPKKTHKSTIVQFMPKLVEEVSGAEKYFLGVDFERLEYLQRVSPDSSQT